jgi:hypothetical protein
MRNALDAGKSIIWASGRGLGPGNRDFFKPCEMALSRCTQNGCHISYFWTYDLYGPIHNALDAGIETLGECHLGPKKGEISKAQPPPTCQSNGFAHIKIIMYRAESI